jgi:hypothetical protein
MFARKPGHWWSDSTQLRSRWCDAAARQAIDAYQRYLAYREHAEPPFRERTEAARTRLAALVAER